MSEPVPASTGAQGASARDEADWPTWSSDLHQSLASQEASAAELRHDLDDLRRTLDATPTRTPAPRTRSIRTRGLVAGGAGLVLALTLAGGLAARSARPGSAAEAGPGAAPGPRLSASARATPTASAAGPTPGPTSARGTAGPSAPPLPDWPGRGVPQPPDLPAHGVGADLSGTELTAALVADGSVEVYERAVLTPGATALTLRPAGMAAIARTLAASPPVVEDLHAEIDGRPVPVTQSASGWTVAAPAGTTAVRLELRYRLTGALLRREPAPPGRYTLVLAPLAPSAGDGADTAVAVRITDPRIEELYCPAAANQLCGRADGDVHTATVPAGAVPVVVALVTLPG
ncbi:MAG TPA: hypothetical protein VMT69_01040 [Kineosporiaceae bacterium]|nr:hypothetical protein [Kineosporiaceae bacterium]